MRAAAVVSALALLALVALTLLPEAAGFRSHLTLAALAVGGVLLVLLFASPRGEAKVAAQPAKSLPVAPAPVPVAKNQAEAEVVSFLALLQEKGRLVDFLMDDITRYPDAQVGAAARVVHEGCRGVLVEHFRIVPVREEPEGATITVPAAAPGDTYRLVGRIVGEAPFSGRLVHRGWRTETVKLSRILPSADERLPVIAPAQVELT